MPLYEYRCYDCGHQFEMLRPMREANEPAVCRSCNNGAQRDALGVRVLLHERRRLGSAPCRRRRGLRPLLYHWMWLRKLNNRDRIIEGRYQRPFLFASRIDG